MTLDAKINKLGAQTNSNMLNSMMTIICPVLGMKLPLILFLGEFGKMLITYFVLTFVNKL